MKEYTWLQSSEIKSKHKKYGLNKLPEAKTDPIYLKILRQFHDMMVYILLVACFIALLHWAYVDSAIIFSVVIINAIIGFIQEFKADKALAALKSMLSPHSTVIRDGKKQQIASEEIVPGDILYIEAWIKVPADALILESNSLKIEEAALTWESVPVGKQKISIDEQDEIIKNIQTDNEIDIKSFSWWKQVYMWTKAAYWTGIALVHSTWASTSFWKIAHETSNTTKELSPLEKELNNIGMFVWKVALWLSLILVLVSVYVYKQPFGDALLFSVSVAVAAVPEGLLATMTIALALSVRKLAWQNAIVRKLSSVETLGWVTVICSDKTGTLTKNQMTITQFWNNDQINMVSGTGYGLEWEVSGDIAEPLIKKATQISALCINASIRDGEVIGDPTEGAFIPFVNKTVSYIPDFKEFSHDKDSVPLLQKQYPRVRELPFDDVRKMMSVIHDMWENKQLLAKWALASILSRSTRILQNDGNIIPLTDKEKENITTNMHSMSDQALRVLALAYKEVWDDQIEAKDNELESDLIFVWLVGQIDPPRDMLAETIADTQKAGIKTIIITWDAPKTALAIAHQVWIVQNKETAEVYIGEKVEEKSDDELQKILDFSDWDREVLFARVAPVHKKRVVAALQKNHHIVAVTWDWVNDAPALKKWDIWIAMWIAWTDVSKESADVVLADDSFNTIVKAIVEWRVIYSNFKKFILYLFSSNVAELTLIFIAMIFGLPLPLTAVMILVINLWTDVFPALALWIDDPEKDVINQQPRDTHSKIMNKRFITVFTSWWVTMWIIISILYYYFLQETGSQLYAQTVAFCALVCIQLTNSFMWRTFDNSMFSRNFLENKLLVIWAVFWVSLLMLFTNVEFFKETLKMETLTLSTWWIIVTLCIVIVSIWDQIKKRISF